MRDVFSRLRIESFEVIRIEKEIYNYYVAMYYGGSDPG